MKTMYPRSIRRKTLLLAAVLCVSAAQAWAHAKLDHAEPAVDGMAKQSPTEVRLSWCSQLLCAGCTNMAREAQRSDGFLDFVVAIAGRPRKDVVPLERVSERTGKIVSAHAEVDHRGGTYVSGILHKGSRS